MWTDTKMTSNSKQRTIEQEIVTPMVLFNLSLEVDYTFQGKLFID